MIYAKDLPYPHGTIFIILNIECFRSLSKLMKRLACCTKQSVVEWSRVSGVMSDLGLLLYCPTRLPMLSSRVSLSPTVWDHSQKFQLFPFASSNKSHTWGGHYDFFLCLGPPKILLWPHLPRKVLSALSRYCSRFLETWEQIRTCTQWDKGVARGSPPSQTLRWKAGC